MAALPPLRPKVSTPLPVFGEMSATEFLEVINIVGIAAFGTVADYPDPLLYLAKSIYPGCYISVSDIITAESISKGQKKLTVPGVSFIF